MITADEIQPLQSKPLQPQPVGGTGHTFSFNLRGHPKVEEIDQISSISSLELSQNLDRQIRK
jgi:hypothetical protein